MARRLKISFFITAIVLGLGLIIFLLGPVLFASITYPLPQEYQAPIAKWSNNYNISPNFLAALIFTESGFNPRARSGAGAISLVQFIPSTAVGVAKRLGVSPFSPNDLIANPELAIRFAAYYVADDISRYGSPKLALIAYQQGAYVPGTVGYADKVLRIEKAYDSIYGQWWKNLNSSNSNSPTQFDVKPKNSLNILSSVSVLDFWKTFLSNPTNTSSSADDTLNNFWKNLLPGS
jgi:hypothetical protein